MKSTTLIAAEKLTQQQLSDLLPGEVLWGDSLTPELLREILSRALLAQQSDSVHLAGSTEHVSTALEAGKHYRDAIATVCEGWTLPADARKILETALWSNQPPIALLDGWKLVPIEPTREMVQAACDKHGYPGGDRFTYARGYKAMLAAAPLVLAQNQHVHLAGSIASNHPSSEDV
jgi:hypothetical protein